MDNQRIVFGQFHEQQQKYIYYLITICAAAIGFAIQKSSGQPLKIIMIPLGLALLFWALSIYMGLNRLKYGMSNLYANIEYLNIKQGIHPETGDHPEIIEAASQGVKQAIDSNNEKASKFFKRQNTLFLLGMLSFIVWHLLEMYHTTAS